MLEDELLRIEDDLLDDLLTDGVRGVIGSPAVVGVGGVDGVNDCELHELDDEELGEQPRSTLSLADAGDTISPDCPTNKGSSRLRGLSFCM